MKILSVPKIHSEIRYMRLELHNKKKQTFIPKQLLKKKKNQNQIVKDIIM